MWHGVAEHSQSSVRFGVKNNGGLRLVTRDRTETPCFHRLLLLLHRRFPIVLEWTYAETLAMQDDLHLSSQYDDLTLPSSYKDKWNLGVRFFFLFYQRLVTQAWGVGFLVFVHQLSHHHLGHRLAHYKWGLGGRPVDLLSNLALTADW